MSNALKSPYPYFGGKSRIAAQIWARLGNVPNYVEPFLGSAAVILARPAAHWDTHTPLETVNDKDAMVSNFWRALQADPEAVAHYADWPANENDLHARHAWLVGQKASLQAQLEGDPEYYDAKIAGWWVWGMACWIGGEFCSGNGPWQVQDGRLLHLGDAGRGVKRRLLHLGSQGGFQGILGRAIFHNLRDYMQALALRFQRVRVCSGDWARVTGPSVTVVHSVTGVVLDPPYGHDVGRDTTVYAHDEDMTAAVLAWCQEWGTHPQMRIAVCGYEAEYVALEADGWSTLKWRTHGGFGSQSTGQGRQNKTRETVWFSPHCLSPATQQLTLFEETHA